MSQRVTLTYSVELEELETEVQRLINNALDKLEDSYGEHADLTSGDVLSFDTLEEIDTLRKTLAQADLILADVSTIIASYLQYKSSELASSSIIDREQLEQLASLNSVKSENPT